MAKIKIAAIDGALRNFGIVRFIYDTDDQSLALLDMKLVETAKSKDKRKRSSSDYLERAQKISAAMRERLSDVSVVFGEVPSGGQDYNSVYGFGIVVGLYASVAQPFIEVSPAEAKLAAVGSRNAAKQEMIEWAFERYPDAEWLTRKLHGEVVPVQKNEHLADACAIAESGVKEQQFQVFASMAGAMSKNVA